MRDTTSKSHATVLITDPGFMMPSICVALQIVDQFTSALQSDVFIICLHLADAEIDELNSIFGSRGLTFLPMDARRIGQDVALGDTHISQATLGRFFLHEIIPEKYTDILYIDGDIQLNKQIAELLALRLDNGMIAAAPDSIWLYDRSRTDYGERVRSYHRYFGRSSGRGYFNAGVLAFRRSTWDAVGPKAWQFFRNNKDACLFHDQSALNVVCADRVQWLSPAYNFSTDYRVMGFGAVLETRMLHFTGPMKPWLTRAGPWSGKAVRVYDRFQLEYPVTQRYVEASTPARRRALRNQWLMNTWKGIPGVRDPRTFAALWSEFRTMIRETPFVLS